MRERVYRKLIDPIELLLRLAEGQTMREIALDLNVSTALITHRIDDWKVELEAKTHAELIAKAYHQGILVPLGRRVSVGREV